MKEVRELNVLRAGATEASLETRRVLYNRGRRALNVGLMLPFMLEARRVQRMEQVRRCPCHLPVKIRQKPLRQNYFSLSNENTNLTETFRPCSSSY